MVVGSAKDIVEECGVARYVFTDFPLGNPVGKPFDAEMQSAVVSTALDLLEKAWMPRTTVQTPFVWDASTNNEWRDHFMHIDEDNLATYAAAGEARRKAQSEAKTDGRARTS